MRNRFDLQLKQLNDDIIEMGNMIERAIEMGVYALIGHDTDKAKQTIDYDMDIDHMERDIEALCMKLLLQQQPVAKDLRAISSALKMITDMKRIGDQSADIADIILTAHINAGDDALSIGDMASAAIKMVTDSIDAFVKKDIDIAEAVIDYDDIVDGYFTSIKSLLTQRFSVPENDGEYALDLLMIAKYFERIADHAVNIAQWVLFSITGNREGGN